MGLFSLSAALFAVRAVMAASGRLGGDTLFPVNAGLYQWMAVTGAVFITLRGFVLLLMAAERNHALLLTLSQQDPLTGVLNRSGLRAAFERLARESRRFTTVSLLIVDLDHFKAINDTHGHTTGDAVLRLFATVARSELRAMDTLARQGGDEFVVVLPRTQVNGATMVAERIRKAFAAASSHLPELRIRPTLSIGAAEGDIVADGLDAILHRADEALYQSKRTGRNKVSAL